MTERADGKNLAPGAQTTIERVANIVAEACKDLEVPGTHLEISSNGVPGVEGTEELQVSMVDDATGEAYVTNRQPV